ncbi:MAG: BrnT family toxin [Elusimicrobiota bacterium]|nr:BrnT family toxin [Elusimicrobiota bacterium]
MKQTFYPAEFEWDEKNKDKNWEKHKVKYTEIEDVFFNSPIIADVDKSKILYNEERKIAYGLTNDNRLLFVIFTIRNKKIRVISARDMGKKDRRFYEETKKVIKI